MLFSSLITYFRQLPYTLIKLRRSVLLRYNIYLCRRCGGICAGRDGASTFRCTYCGEVNHAGKSRKIAKEIDSNDIQATIARIKMERAEQNKKLG